MLRNPARRCAAVLLAATSFDCSGSGSSAHQGAEGTPSQAGAVATGGLTGIGANVAVGGISSNGDSGGIALGGHTSSGGSAVTGGSTSSGGFVATGGTLTGAKSSTGGAATGGQSATGGTTSAGGKSALGGTTAGGKSSTGGGATSGSSTGGKSTTGGAATGGAATGGQSATGGTTSAATTAITCPCDIYASGSTPCVAAHSTVRALYGAYDGNLYQVKRASDNTTKDIGVLMPGGFANAAAQDTFCSGTTCTIPIIYDQSGKSNHLTVAPAGGNGSADVAANATALKLTVGGHSAYAIYVSAGVGYRNNRTTGIATGSGAEGEYMVASGTHVNDGCCFDYGNAETNNTDTGNGHMEAIYLGKLCWFTPCNGSGPWVMADLENGLFSGANGSNPNNTSMAYDYVTAVVKGNASGYAIKGGNAQTGSLKTLYSGALPSTSGYNPMHKEGAIILGIGGDNSKVAVGTFFEGAMTSGYPSDTIENAVQTNIVAAGYGR